jgi:hypothetical protein
LRLNLRQDQCRQDGREEHGKDTVLQRAQAVVEAQKGETDDERDGDVRKEALIK